MPFHVSKGGLEPPRDCSHQHLKLVLPIPPPASIRVCPAQSVRLMPVSDASRHVLPCRYCTLLHGRSAGQGSAQSCETRMVDRVPHPLTAALTVYQSRARQDFGMAEICAFALDDRPHGQNVPLPPVPAERLPLCT